ncbi:MAG: P-type conjugative transfer ATPase TrbB [Enterococcus sp.]|jgi:type IV secretion system protein VirB11|nr:P-type conjugative transfer ATPase TrbB [Enterococcus sp.]MDD2466222.1 P-type conjugative transfer ATPase TrbB [Desulfobulbus sp.]
MVKMDHEVNPSVKERAIEKLRRDLGPIVVKALADPRTVEVLLNADGALWQEKLGEKMVRIGTMSPQRATAVLNTVAGYHGKTVTRFSPLIEGELPLDGSRFAGQLPPVVQEPTFAIRKKAVSVFTLDQYLEQNIMTGLQISCVKQAIADHKNILVIGGTGSGKTTLVNAIIQEMVVCNPSERVCIIEDTGEIQCTAENCVQYHTTLEVTMTMLLKTILRMRPDRILVGEVRGPEALDLLDAWNTGHEGGAATLHANDEISALLRLKSLITRNSAAPSDIESLIGEAVHTIVHISRTPEGRAVQGIVDVLGFENGKYITKRIV